MATSSYPRELAEDLTKDLPKFPDLDSYKKGLLELTSMNLEAMTYAELEKLFYERAVLFQQTFGMQDLAIFNTQTFYRVRMGLGEGENPDLIRTHSYPPANFCKGNGRANIKGKSVFYCSDDAATSILESKPQPGQVGFVSVWKGAAHRNVKYSVCLPRDLRTDNIHQVVAETVHDLVNERSHIAGDKAQHFQFLNQFIADRFVREMPPYCLSSWIANEMLYTDIGRDFILYPSIATQTYSCNMAFHPNSADSLLRFEKVLRFRFNGFDGSQISFSNVGIGTPEFSTMKWRKATESDLLEILKEVSSVDTDKA